MDILVNGRWVDVADLGGGMVNAGDVRRAANIGEDRALVLRKPTGENELLSNNSYFRSAPNFMLIDQPISERGQ